MMCVNGRPWVASEPWFGVFDKLSGSGIAVSS